MSLPSNPYLFLSCESLRETNLCLNKEILYQILPPDSLPNIANIYHYGAYASSLLEEMRTLYDFTNNELVQLLTEYHLYYPWLIGYDTFRLNFNQREIRFPYIIIFPHSSREIEHWIQLARERGLRISVRSGGCCFLDFSIQNQLVVDTTLLPVNECLLIDLKTKVVHLSPGVRLGTLYTELFKHDYVIAGGICPNVAVGGLFIQGIGYFLRKYGYSCDSVKEVEIVVGTGQKLVANKKQNTELFKACRGAASSFGCITRYTVKIHHVSTVLYFTYTYDLKNLGAVMDGFAKITQTATPDLAGIVVNLAAGADFFFVNGIFIKKSKKELETILRDLTTPEIADIREMKYSEVATLLSLETPTSAFMTVKSFFYSTLVNDWQPLINFMQSSIPNGITIGLQVVGMGGYLNQESPDTVIVARQGYVGWLSYGIFWSDSSLDGVVARLLHQLTESLATIQTSVYYLNYPEEDATVENYFGPYVPFLKKVKKQYDPEGVFDFSQGIKIDCEVWPQYYRNLDERMFSPAKPRDRLIS